MIKERVNSDLLSKVLTASGVSHSENFLENACPRKIYNVPVARRLSISSWGELHKLKHSGQLPGEMSKKGRCQGETIVTCEADRYRKLAIYESKQINSCHNLQS